MCGDSHLPPAPESGDLVAVIHPNQKSTFHGRLKLSNRLPGATASSLQCENLPASTLCGTSPLEVRIHKYGQPLSFSTPSSETDSDEDEDVPSNPIMHSFIISPMASSTTADLRLNLGVGGDGVVGRTVSIFDDRSRKIVGEGILGWI